MPRGRLSDGAPESLFGLRWRTTSTCPAGHTSERDAPSTVLELSPPPAPAGGGPRGGAAASSFAAALQASLATSSRTRGWCEACRAYVMLDLRRAAASLPPLLCLSVAGLGGAGGAAKAAAAAAATTPAVAAAAAGGARRVVPATPWVPQVVLIRLGGPAGVAVVDGSAGPLPAVPPNAPSEALYCVVGALCHVASPAKDKVAAGGGEGAGGSGKRGRGAAAATAAAAAAAAASAAAGGASDAAALRQSHYVACVRAGPEGALAPSAAPSLHAPADWLVFNHFRVTPAPAAEVRGRQEEESQ